MHMQVLNVPVLREVIEDPGVLAVGLGILASGTGWLLRHLHRKSPAALTVGLGILASTTGWLLRRLYQPIDDLRSSVRPHASLSFSHYRDALNSRERQIRDAMSGATGNGLILLKAELAAVEDMLSNLADSFFVLKSELAQAAAALMSMQSQATQSEIIGARTALNTGDTRPAELIFERAANSGMPSEQTAEGHYRLGRLALANIDYTRGLQHLRQASELAPDDLRVNASLAELVDVLVTLVDAEPLPPAVLRVLEEVLLVQGRPTLAEQLYQGALSFYERNFGPDYPKTVRNLKDLARLYRRQQKHDQAEPLYLRMLAIAERSVGPSGPEIAVILEKLGSVYDAQERRECVLHTLRRLLMIKEAALGPNHPDVIGVVSRLAQVSRDLGRLSDAKLLYRRLLGVMEGTFGPDHSKLVVILNELAAVCDLAEDYRAAEALYRRALSIRERALCGDGPSCVNILRNLAEVYRKQGKHRLAEPLHRRVMAHSERALGLEHSDFNKNAASRERSDRADCRFRRAQCTGGDNEISKACVNSQSAAKIA